MMEDLHAPRALRAPLERAEHLLSEVRTQLEGRLRGALPADVPLAPAFEAERKTMRPHHGPLLSYYEDRTAHGRPLVLIHSINACASAYEMKPLFERFRGKVPVYAPDLPGFGFSERDARPYTPELYVDELIGFLGRVKDKDDAPDVVALSLSCELVARVAVARKDLIHSLTFISPTGFDAKGDGHGRALIPGGGRASSHWWSKLAFSAVASQPSIRYFLGKTFVGPVDEGLRSYAYATSHQPGAEHAPLDFLSGKLFTPDIFDTYAKIDRPVLALYDRDAFARLDRLQELADRSPLWQSKRIAPSLGMPQFERLEETVTALEAFWRDAAHTAHHSHS